MQFRAGGLFLTDGNCLISFNKNPFVILRSLIVLNCFFFQFCCLFSQILAV